jgi:hypothetical protein
MFCNGGANLMEILGKGFRPLPNLHFLLWRTFGRTSLFGIVIQASKVSRFPRLKPMINGNTINLKNIRKLCGRMTLKTQEKTMYTLSDTMMLAVFVYSL